MIINISGRGYRGFIYRPALSDAGLVARHVEGAQDSVPAEPEPHRRLLSLNSYRLPRIEHAHSHLLGACTHGSIGGKLPSRRSGGVSGTSLLMR